jgi:hypothetical protein
MATFQHNSIHSLTATFAPLARPANLDELVLSRNRQRSIVVAHNVSDWELGAAIILCSCRESLDRMRQQSSRSALSERRLDIIVKEWDGIGDSRRQALVMDVSRIATFSLPRQIGFRTSTRT